MFKIWKARTRDDIGENNIQINLDSQETEWEVFSKDKEPINPIQKL